MTARATPSMCGGRYRTQISGATAAIMAAPNPWITRPARRMFKSGEIPQMKDDRVNMINPLMKIFFMRPRSAIFPKTRRKPAIIRR